jgi:catechol 2,3-dioxygenase-like lactoylglutathione lyase family enzyme
MMHSIDTLVSQFERGRLTRRQLVQGLLLVATSPVAAQERRPGAFRATGIDHVQITVSNVESSQQFYERLFGVTGVRTSATQLDLPMGTAGDFISLHSESGRVKPIDHFGIMVESLSRDAAIATIERVVPGTTTQRSGDGDSVFVTGPEGVRFQLMPSA